MPKQTIEIAGKNYTLVEPEQLFEDGTGGTCDGCVAFEGHEPQTTCRIMNALHEELWGTSCHKDNGLIFKVVTDAT